MPRSSLVDPSSGDTLLRCAQALMDLRSPEVDALDCDSGIVTAAEFHRISPGLHVLLRHRDDLIADVQSRLAAAHADQLIRHVAALADIRTLGRTAAEVGTPWAVLKGPALAETVWPRPDLRASYDLDVLVPAAAVPAVLAELTAHGAVVPPQPWAQMRRQRQAQLTLVLPSGGVCDLHWDLVSMGRERRLFRLPTADLLAAARPAMLGDVEAPVLAPDDALVHAAVHTVLAAAGRLVWLLDLAHLATAREDWDGLIDRARATRTALVLAVALERAGSVAPDAVPGDVVRRLSGGAAWARWVASVSARRPIASGAGRRGQGRLLVSATRTGTATSVTTALGAVPRAVSWLGRTPREGPSLHGPQRPEDLRQAVRLAADIDQ